MDVEPQGEGQMPTTRQEGRGRNVLLVDLEVGMKTIICKSDTTEQSAT